MSGNNTIISLFAGGGGSSVGYNMAGFNELLAIEWEKNAIETLKANFTFDIWQTDITKIKNGEILERCNIEKGELDVLDGSPPCQGFSTAGKRKIFESRNDLYKSYIKILKDIEPKVFIMENVSGMMKGRMKGRFNEILKELKCLNYNVKCKLMNAKYYDVPQSRERLIFIGVRKDIGLQPCFPQISENIITVKDAIGDCDNGLSDDVFSGDRMNIAMNIAMNSDGSHVIQGQSFNLKRLDWNRPSRCVLKSIGRPDKLYGGGLIHPDTNRHLNINELKRICSFPDDFILVGSFKQQWERLGNAVMPKMMFAIASCIKINILEKYYAST